jgi:hypothetical protein
VTCAWHMGNLTFQAYPANVFKPSKGGSCGCRGSVAEDLDAAAGLQYVVHITVCNKSRITCRTDLGLIAA